jgi:hypothetical protein
MVDLLATEKIHLGATLACIHHKFQRILPNLLGKKDLMLPALCF